MTDHPHADGKPCVACPVEVRDLYACAANAVQAFQAALDGTGEAARAVRKLQELRESVARMAPIVEAHFAEALHKIR